MTNREYFEQAIRLDQKINTYIREAEQLREMAASVTSPSLGDRVQTSQRTEAPFVRWVDKVMEMEEKINREIDALVDLKAEIGAVIDTLPDEKEQMVMRYRYLCNMNWENIAAEIGVNPRTVRRWHGSALEHAVQP